ncbi:MAG: phosphotransferase [Anaerolineales bacterium]|jgi:Ser/Thr protein kinase RdoA (MazF antagonist)
MKAYNELSRRGRLRRLRSLAEVALQQYGMEGAKLTFTHYEGNVIFRVDVTDSVNQRGQSSLYVPNRYNLRILTTSNAKGVESELTWLTALSEEAGLPVPQPVPTLDGRYLIKVATPGVPDGRLVSMMRWLDGRRMLDGLRPKHFRSWGETMGKLHNFSEKWQPPKGFTRPHWDWEGQLGGREFRFPMDEVLAAIPKRYLEAFQIVSKETKKAMEAFGKGSDAYGLIHGDMYPENLLFKGGKALFIDFEDFGYGYWMWDLGVALCSWPWTDDLKWRKEALLDGYAQTRTLPDEQLKHVDLFMAAQQATMVLWATVFILNDPAMRHEHEEWRTREGDRLLRYLER